LFSAYTIGILLGDYWVIIGLLLGDYWVIIGLLSNSHWYHTVLTLRLRSNDTPPRTKFCNYFFNFLQNLMLGTDYFLFFKKKNVSVCVITFVTVSLRSNFHVGGRMSNDGRLIQT
jgi:hypothetical protein